MGVNNKTLPLPLISAVLVSCSALYGCSGSVSGPVSVEDSDTVTALEQARGIEAGSEFAEVDEHLPVSEVLGSEKVAELPSVSAEELGQVEILPAGSEAQAAATMESVSLRAGRDSEGEVVVSLSEQVPFHLKRTAPTEFVLTIPGVTVAAEVGAPQLAPEGVVNIRTTRVIETDSAAQVRMFVGEGVELQAISQGSQIKVQPLAGTPASYPDARGQLADEGVELQEEDDIARVNPTGIVSDDGTKIYTGRLISLDLQDTDIDNALRIIAEVSNLNIIASDDVSGKVTLRLIDVPWDQALDVILKTNGLDQVTEGNVIRIAPVNKLREEREARRDAIKALENLEELKVGYYRVSYARASEITDQVETVLSERGSLSVDERTNQIIIKDVKKGQEEALNLIKRLDLRTPQVLLETQIVEGQRSILRDLGFQWAYGFRRSPETGNATGATFPNTIDTVASAGFNAPTVQTDANNPRIAASGSLLSLILDSADGARSLSANLTAFEQEGRARIISKPQVATVNNKRATIQSVETIRILLPDSGLSVATGAGANAAGGGSAAFEEVDVGIELEVTPNASPDYYVLLDVNAESSTFGDREVQGIPSTIERKATSTILVKSGQTFALGGVYRIEDNDNITGVPWLKDIPVLGHFFRSTGIDKGDEELIFFITPHIVEGSFDPSLI